MTELPPQQPTDDAPVPPAPVIERHPHHHPEQPIMPRWVPIVIGVVLVTIAALAVITGSRYRENTLVRMVTSRQTMPRATAPAPPGEPEPGASRVISGNEGGHVPTANEPVAGGSRAEVTGGPGGVNAVVRMWARRGMQVTVEPADALVYINDVQIGEARQFDSEDEAYDFAAPGSYTVRLVAPGYKERQYVVTASDDAADEVAHIEARLDKQ